MKQTQRGSANASYWKFAVSVVMVLALSACMHHGRRLMHQEAQQSLSGANEVPANNSAATGTGTIRIGRDGSVTGNVVVAGMTPTAAHIHEAPPGKNGPVIVPLAKTADNVFAAAAGARLTDAQYASYLAGNLYVNVHSDAYPGGEIRAQLTANSGR